MFDDLGDQAIDVIVHHATDPSSPLTLNGLPLPPQMPQGLWRLSRRRAGFGHLRGGGPESGLPPGA
ncbi:MAG TPA: hypothetical protein VF148_04300 [Acidimicrobiia bacterium]